jgi:hypothetical protein
MWPTNGILIWTSLFLALDRHGHSWIGLTVKPLTVLGRLKKTQTPLPSLPLQEAEQQQHRRSGDGNADTA